MLSGLLAAVAVVSVAQASQGTASPAALLAPSARLADPGFVPDVEASGPVLPAGVTIAGVDVGGLQLDTAAAFVRASFAQPLTVVLDGRRVRVSPADLGAVAYADGAVRRALASSASGPVDVVVRVPGAGVRSLVDRLAKGFDRAPKARKVALVSYRPTLTGGTPGRRVDRGAAVAAIVRALQSSDRAPVTLPVVAISPTTPAVEATPLIVIRRASNRLELYNGVKLVRAFGVATGLPEYPTPLGTFTIVSKQRDPWWYPPSSDWAKGKEPVPPGPGNPLGTRWMGISSPLVGIHGTPDAASIGYSRSHGCIRMRISEVEWLFDNVEHGTTVMIVNA